MFSFNFYKLFQKKPKKDTQAAFSTPFFDIEQTTFFQEKGISLILDYMNNSDYNEHRTLIREIIYLIEATFNVLKDDYQYGSHVLYQNFPRIDNYIFSDYRNDPKLKDNIHTLLIISFSNRFHEDPKENLMSYYVFLEEIGFEVSIFFNDYYSMLVDNKPLTPLEHFPNANYQAVLHQLYEENVVLKPLEANKLIVTALIEKKLLKS